MRVFVAIFLLVTGLVHGFAHALDFKITEVVEVGPIYGMVKPAQWSPDGTKLAYFYDGQLMIADTLGKSRPAAKIDLPPHRFVWSSDSTIILYQWDYLPRDSVDQNMRTIDRMISINVETGTQTLLEEFVHRVGDKSEKIPRIFKGPYLTVEGNAYYFVQENYQADKSPPKAKIQMAPGVSPDKASPAQNHILRAGSDGLYLVQVDYKDSIKISNKPYNPPLDLWMRMYLSKDRTHLLNNGVIVRLEDDKTVILDTLVRRFPKPKGTEACGSVQEVFNPVYPEVAFNLTCDDGHNYIFDRIAVFDYTTYELTVLDSLIGLTNCHRPAYAPDGKKIAFLADHKAYIIYREID